jgi:hypothetical protein
MAGRRMRLAARGICGVCRGRASALPLRMLSPQHGAIPRNARARTPCQPHARQPTDNATASRTCLALASSLEPLLLAAATPWAPGRPAPSPASRL